MPLLLTESLDPVRRELTHQHIESCAVCGAEWDAYKDTWTVLGDLPEVDVPARVKAKFMIAAGLAESNLNSNNEEKAPANVVPFHRRKSFQWLAQAAAVVLIAGGSYFAGNSNRVTPVQEPAETPAHVTAVSMNPNIMPVSLAETRVLDAGALSPEIQGRPNINNVQFVDSDPSDDKIGVSFDVTSRWTVTGNPRDKSLVRLFSYMMENEGEAMPRSGAIESVRRMYADPANADPEIANALAKILRNDAQHEGVRLRAVETLTTLPASGTIETREALIEALKSDPNPAVRIKAVEALANLARSGDSQAVDTLRQKASQQDENAYVRVKAAEALSNIK